MRLAIIAPLLLVACSGKEEIADKVEERADQRAEAMEEAGEEMENALQQNIVEQQARTKREAGEERADAIRESDLDAGQLSQEQKNALVQADDGTAGVTKR